MRISRRHILHNPSGTIHKFWRCHNREHLLKSPQAKKNYLRSTAIGLKHRNLDGKVKLQAYCVMDNHSHQILGYSDGVDYVSSFMRISHGDFGRAYNKENHRTGKVANERPRTVVIQETDESLMRTHMYLEANPIRAGMRKFENLKLYECSSFKFYAFGIKDEFTELLEIPQWYLNLGNTPEERQKKYRSLFQLYLRQGQTKHKLVDFLGIAIGEAIWTLNHMRKVRELAKASRAGPR